MIKQWLYTKFAEYYHPSTDYIPLKHAAFLLEKFLGYAVFDYGGIKLTAGPYALLDYYIIHKHNINPHLTSALTQYLRDGGIFLDIGANHGVFSLLAAKNPKTEVYAFEPSPRELKRLQLNLQLNPSSNITVFPYGLGDEEKEQALAIYSADNPGKNSLPAVIENHPLVTCHFSTLPKLLDADSLQKARVCKMDVEGQEMLILNSLKPYMSILNRCVFVIEMSPAYLSKLGFTVEDIYAFFQAAGFRSQFGNPDKAWQWEEFFYHPDYASELIFSEDLP